MHSVLCVLPCTLGRAVQKAELESAGSLLLSCVLLHAAKALLEFGNGGGDSGLCLVHVLRKAPGGGSVERGDTDSEVWRVLGVSVRLVDVLLRVAQVVCAGGVCVGAYPVDGMRGVVSDALVGDVERSKQVKRCVSVRSDGSGPEGCAGACFWVDFGCFSAL
jgi:hypothetical protein